MTSQIPENVNKLKTTMTLIYQLKKGCVHMNIWIHGKGSMIQNFHHDTESPPHDKFYSSLSDSNVR